MSKVTEKIEKLLRVAQDRAATSAEAANAMEKAIRLARAHAINLENIDISGDSIKEQSFAIVTIKTRATGDAEKLVAELIQTFFYVRIVFGYKSVSLFGSPHHCAIAEHFFVYLVRSFRGCWAVARSQDKRLKRRPYLVAMQRAIGWKLFELYPEALDKKAGTGLMISLDTFVDDQCGELKSVKSVRDKSKAHASQMAGHQAGTNTDLNHGISGGKQAKEIL